MRTLRLTPSPLITKLLMYPSSLRIRAISSFNFEAGTSTRECFAAMALRIRVNMSAIGSVIPYSIFDCQLPIADLKNWKLAIGNRQCYLPTRLNYAGYLPLERQLAETDAA